MYLAENLVREDGCLWGDAAKPVFESLISGSTSFNSGSTSPAIQGRYASELTTRFCQPQSQLREFHDHPSPEDHYPVPRVCLANLSNEELADQAIRD